MGRGSPLRDKERGCEGASPSLGLSDHLSCLQPSPPQRHENILGDRSLGIKVVSERGYRREIGPPLSWGPQTLLIVEAIRDHQEERGPHTFSKSLQKLAVLFKINSFPRLHFGLVL